MKPTCYANTTELASSAKLDTYKIILLTCAVPSYHLKITIIL